MKTFFFLVLAIWSTSTFGQTPALKLNQTITDSVEKTKDDRSLKVVYANNSANMNKIAFFLNGKLVNESFFAIVDPQMIDNICVEKVGINIDNVYYEGQVYMNTKDDYTTKQISLTDLKDKYTNLKGKSALFMIDGEIIDADYSKYIVDENYLLMLIVDKIDNPKENISINFVKLFTKSPINIKKSKEIRIRGTEITFNNLSNFK